ncbi:MAG: TraB/GumN family protein [Bacteroidetes bacterium]|nr:TraB/GumN family protein [Bacteroidota bacterium]
MFKNETNSLSNRTFFSFFFPSPFRRGVRGEVRGSFALFAFFVVSLTSGCRPQTPTTDILHTVERNGSTFHILGSMHLGKGFVLSDSVKKIIESVDQVIFEIDMKEMTDQTAAIKLMPLMMLPDGKTLEDIFPVERIATLRTKYTKAGVAWMIVEKQKPLFGAITAIGYAAMKQGIQADKGTENLVYEYSQKFSKPTSGFETMRFQMGLFDSVSYDMQYEIAISTLDQLDSLKGDLSALLAAFQGGDPKELEKYLKTGFGEGEDLFNRVFLVNRNRDWAIKIEELSKQKKKFLVVVGAGHLVGDGSLLQFLKME